MQAIKVRAFALTRRLFGNAARKSVDGNVQSSNISFTLP
jgi:hypothetical protein